MMHHFSFKIHNLHNPLHTFIHVVKLSTIATDSIKWVKSIVLTFQLQTQEVISTFHIQRKDESNHRQLKICLDFAHF